MASCFVLMALGWLFVCSEGVRPPYSLCFESKNPADRACSRFQQHCHRSTSPHGARCMKNQGTRERSCKGRKLQKCRWWRGTGRGWLTAELSEGITRTHNGSKQLLSRFYVASSLHDGAIGSPRLNPRGVQSEHRSVLTKLASHIAGYH